MNGPDDERLHRGEGDLIDGIEAEIDPIDQDILAPPIANTDIAAKAAQVRSQRGEQTEEEQQAQIEVRKLFTGSIPPPPPPPGSGVGGAKAITTADEPDGTPGEPGSSDEEDSEEADAGETPVAATLAPPPPAELPAPTESSWLAPRNESGE